MLPLTGGIAATAAYLLSVVHVSRQDLRSTSLSLDDGRSGIDLQLGTAECHQQLLPDVLDLLCREVEKTSPTIQPTKRDIWGSQTLPNMSQG